LKEAVKKKERLSTEYTLVSLQPGISTNHCNGHPLFLGMTKIAQEKELLCFLDSSAEESV
jgi:hypothetical protein